MTNNELKLKIATALDNAGLKATKDQINGLAKDIKSLNRTGGQGQGGVVSKLFSGTEIGKLAKLGVAVGAITVAVKGFISVCRLASDSIKQAFEFQYIQHQFKYLYGSMEKAKQHMEDLKDLGSTPPFSLQEFAKASRSMTAFSDGALGAKASLKMVGDAAAAVGAPVEQVGEVVARAYAQIRDGEPVGRIGNQLKNLGLITPATVKELNEMQKAGASNIEIWEKLTKALSKYEGAMKETEKTAKGAAEALSTSWQNLKTTLGESATEQMVGPQNRMKEALDDLQPVAQKIGAVIGNITGNLANAKADLYEGVARLLTGKSDQERELERIKRQAEALEAEEKARAEEMIRQQEAFKEAEANRINALPKSQLFQKIKEQFAQTAEGLTDGLNKWLKKGAVNGLKEEIDELNKTQKGMTDEYNRQTEAVKRQLDYVKELDAEVKKAEEEQKENLGKGYGNWRDEQNEAEKQAKRDEATRDRNRKRAENRLKLLESRGGIFGEKGLTPKEQKEIERLRKFIGDEDIANAQKNLEDAKDRFRELNDKAQSQLDKLGTINQSIDTLTATLKQMGI